MADVRALHRPWCVAVATGLLQIGEGKVTGGPALECWPSADAELVAGWLAGLNRAPQGQFEEPGKAVRGQHGVLHRDGTAIGKADADKVDHQIAPPQPQGVRADHARQVALDLGSDDECAPATAGNPPDKIIFFQNGECLPQRRPADAKGGRERALSAEPLAWAEPPGCDLVGQNLAHILLGPPAEARLPSCWLIRGSSRC